MEIEIENICTRVCRNVVIDENNADFQLLPPVISVVSFVVGTLRVFF